MLLALLVPAALAAGPVDSVIATAQAQGLATPDMIVSCSPTSKVLDIMGMVPLPPTLTMKAQDDPAARLGLELLDKSNAVARGLDLDGGLSFVLYEDGNHGLISVPFSGDAAQAEALLTDTGDTIVPLEDGKSWLIPSKKGQDLATLTDGALLVRTGTPPEGAFETSPLIEGLPEVPGCMVFFHSDEMPGKDAIPGAGLAGAGADGGFDMSLFVPLSGGAPALVRMGLPQAAPELFSVSRRAPVGGSSLQAPSAIISFGLPLFEVLDLFPESDNFSKSDLEFISSRVTIEPGLTLAFFGRPNELDMAAVVPVTDGKGQPIKTRKLVKQIYKGMKKEGMTVEKLDKDSISVLADGKLVFVRAAPNALVAGTNAMAVSEAAFGMGEPWTESKFSAYASEWPVAVTAGQSTEAGSAEVFAGIRSTGGIWELAMEVKVDDPNGMMGPAMASGLGMAMAAMGPQFQQISAQARRAEVPSNVDSLYAAVEAHHASTGSYLALPPAPRSPEVLNKDEVSFEAGELWTGLDWNPGEVRGSYWTQVSEDGNSVEVHGVIDADGDGVPAHYVRATGGETTQLTPDTVY